MLELTDPIKLIIAFIIGAVIGLERESSEDKLRDTKKDPYVPFGLRTGALVAVLGVITGMLFNEYQSIAVFLASVFGVLLLIYYGFHSYLTKDIGITTEITLIYIFILGFIIHHEIIPMQLILAISVILILVLSRKAEIKDIVQNVKKREINALVSYGLIAAVILPFLPNTGISLTDIPVLNTLTASLSGNAEKLVNIELINPFKLWFIVALITGIDILGHILERTIGQRRGWLVASIVGGFISSTATTQSLAQQSKGAKGVNHLLSAAVFSNLASFFQVAILIATLNTMFFIKAIPTLLAIIFSALIIGIYFQKVKDTKTNAKTTSDKVLKKGEIINLWPALKFALLFVAINLVSKISLALFGSSGFLLTSAIGALPGIDAVIINTTELVGSTIDVRTGVIALLIVNAVNLLSKSVYSFTQGDRKFAKKFTISMLIIIASSLIGLFFI